MIILINVPSKNRHDDIHDRVIAHLTKTLARLVHRITSASVTLTDENGPRRGIDHQCRVNVVISGVGQFTTSAKHESPLAAVRLATARARRMILTRIKRPKALRGRSRKGAPKPVEFHTEKILPI